MLRTRLAPLPKKFTFGKGTTRMFHSETGLVYRGISDSVFSEEIVDKLKLTISLQEVQIRRNGGLYLHESFYRNLLNGTFGIGAWIILPHGDYYFNEEKTTIYRNYILYIHGKCVSEAIGESTIFDAKFGGTTLEYVKSNALFSCCKYLGMASELSNSEFILDWKLQYAVQVICENLRVPGQKKRLWRRRDSPPFDYPYKEVN